MSVDQIQLIIWGLLSLMIVCSGFVLLDGALAGSLVKGLRVKIHTGIVLLLAGISLFAYRLHRFGEWFTIKAAADYHETSWYNARKWAALHGVAEGSWRTSDEASRENAESMDAKGGM